MDALACPHCAAPNATNAMFCATCGKALPTPAAPPRIVDSAGSAQTRLGQHLQVEELAKQTKKAAGALLVVAILQAVFGTIILFMTRANASASRGEVNITVLAIVLYGIAALFLALALWARRSPFPAAIAGLVIFVTLHLVDALADPRTLLQGIVVKIVIIAILIRAISAGAKHRALVRNMGVN